MEPEEQTIEQREAELARRELRVMALERLNEKGLPRELAGILNLSDEQACLASIDAVEGVFRAEVKRQVDARLTAARVSLPAAGVPNENDMTDKEYYARLAMGR